MKIMFAIGTVAALAGVSATAQEGGCNGPVSVPGSVTGSCTCNNTEPHCTGGPVTRRDDYTRCGSTGYTYCHTMNATIGRSGIPCVGSFNSGTYDTLYSLWQDCLLDCSKGNVDCSSCHQPVFCDWNFCTESTTGGTPIVAQVLYELGNYTGCTYAKLQDSPPSVVELALVFLRERGD